MVTNFARAQIRCISHGRSSSRCVRVGYGHWEGDFIVSSVSTAVLLVLVERLAKEAIICWIRDRRNDRVSRVILSALAGKRVASLAVDNDIAFLQHRALSACLAAPIYFARPYRSNDKPLVENANRWIRWFAPKKTDLRDVITEQIGHIEVAAEHRAAPVPRLPAGSDRTVYKCCAC